MPSPDFALIIPAAGRSLRYGSGHSGSGKLSETIAGRSVLAWSVHAFLHRPDVALVIIPTSDEPAARDLIGPLPPTSPTPPTLASRLLFCPGGPSRAESVLQGLQRVPPEIPYIAVHDAARPAVSQALISRVFDAARQHHAAGPATPVTLTIKQSSASSLPAPIERTIPRKTLWAMQTPQAIRTDLLRQAYAYCAQNNLPLADVTDDLQLLELAHLPQGLLVEGEESNLKITLPGDLDRVQLPLHSNPQSAIPNPK